MEVKQVLNKFSSIDISSPENISPENSDFKVPNKGEKNILITAALPYVNNVPHLGNIIGCVLSADVFARYARARKYNVLYIGGTDEYGTATETKAIEEKTTPQKICDKYYKIHRQIYEWFNISFNIFGRTSTKQQTAIAQDIFNRVYQNGYIFPDIVKQLYCSNCEKSLADRLVIGECPRCHDLKCRGDQCELCGKLLSFGELLSPQCRICNHTPITKDSQHLFLDLKKLSPLLKDWINLSNLKGHWSSNSLQVTQSWLKQGLLPRCISRDLSWGTPVPLSGYENKVFYVWFDAPIGYISITACLTDQWEQWWHNPQNVLLYQFIGKDNIPFHTMAAENEDIKTHSTLLHHISTTEYLNYENGKFSKSHCTGIFGDDAMNSGIDSDIYRYYLLINRPETSDTNFTWTDFQAKNNNELLKNFGNFVHRCISFVKKHFHNVPMVSIPLNLSSNEKIQNYTSSILSLYNDFLHHLELVHIKESLHIVMEISRISNVFMQEQTPWVTITSDPDYTGLVMFILIQSCAIISLTISPFLPDTAFKIARYLQLDQSFYCHIQSSVTPSLLLPDFEQFPIIIQPGNPLLEPSILIRKIEDKTITKLKETYSGASYTSFTLDLVVGQIIKVMHHLSSENLYILSIQTSSQQILQVVSGLKSYYSENELFQRNVIVLRNIKHRNIVQVKSQAMVLTAVFEENGVKTISLLTPSVHLPMGSIVKPPNSKLMLAKFIDVKKFGNLPFSLSQGQLYYQKQPLDISIDPNKQIPDKSVIC